MFVACCSALLCSALLLFCLPACLPGCLFTNDHRLTTNFCLRRPRPWDTRGRPDGMHAFHSNHHHNKIIKNKKMIYDSLAYSLGSRSRNAAP
jgi:hypothetical protein